MIISPCISICKTDPLTGYCYGCGRNEEDKKKWKNPKMMAKGPKRDGHLRQKCSKIHEKSKIKPFIVV